MDARTGHQHRQMQPGPFAQQGDVEVAAVSAGRHRAQCGAGGGHADENQKRV